MVTDVGVKFATRNGVKLAYLHAGSGDPPLLLVHGWCCNRTHWREQIPEFSQRHEVVAVDLRGLGDSDRPDQDYTVPGFAEDVAWLFGEIGLQGPVIVGHSMGGVIALNLVREQPELAGAVVFVDAPMIPLPDALSSVAKPLLDGLRSPAYREVVSTWAGNFFFRPESDGELKDEVVKAIAEAPQRLMHTALSSLLSPESVPTGPIPIPSLFVRAETAYATEEQLKHRYPGMEIVTVDAAHFIQMENPHEFNAILRGFLEKVA